LCTSATAEETQQSGDAVCVSAAESTQLTIAGTRATAP